jgi:hypothetical protein
MKSYQSRGEGSSFKHYAEIERQRTDRLYSLKRSSMVSEMTEVEEEEILPMQVTFSPKKQSKRMQKYLKKICEDRNKDFVS